MALKDGMLHYLFRTVQTESVCTFDFLLYRPPEVLLGRQASEWVKKNQPLLIIYACICNWKHSRGVHLYPACLTSVQLPCCTQLTPVFPLNKTAFVCWKGKPPYLTGLESPSPSQRSIISSCKSAFYHFLTGQIPDVHRYFILKQANECYTTGH